MGIQTIDRGKATQIIREAADSLRSSSVVLDDSSVAQALSRACDTMGVDAAHFDALVAADAELARLKDAAITEALSGSTDPGPHDAISREAATGKPGDTTWGPGMPGAFTETPKKTADRS